MKRVSCHTSYGTILAMTGASSITATAHHGGIFSGDCHVFSGGFGSIAGGSYHYPAGKITLLHISTYLFPDLCLIDMLRP